MSTNFNLLKVEEVEEDSDNEDFSLSNSNNDNSSSDLNKNTAKNTDKNTGKNTSKTTSKNAKSSNINNTDKKNKRSSSDKTTSVQPQQNNIINEPKLSKSIENNSDKHINKSLVETPFESVKEQPKPHSSQSNQQSKDDSQKSSQQSQKPIQQSKDDIKIFSEQSQQSQQSKDIQQSQQPQQHNNNNSDHSTESKSKKQAIITRTIWTFIMVSGFFGCLFAGHAWLIMLVMLCQSLSYREVTALFGFKTEYGIKSDNSERDRWSTILNWYFFVVTNYFLYGESIIYYLKHIIFADVYFIQLAKHHRFISFMLYVIGFVGFVANLKRSHLKRQFVLFCWVHMSLLLIVLSSHFIVNNILEGIIWFWVPASLVICNDIFAYIFGMAFGKTPLIKLSPKKTVEGFIGGAFATIIFAFWVSRYFLTQ